MVSEGRWVLGAPEGEVARLPEGGSEGLGGVHGSEGAAGGDGEVGCHRGCRIGMGKGDQAWRLES